MTTLTHLYVKNKYYHLRVFLKGKMNIIGSLKGVKNEKYLDDVYFVHISSQMDSSLG